MGKIDAEVKKYMSRTDIFADMFNFFLYDGEPVIINDKRLLRFVPDYKINLFSPLAMSDEEFSKFHTELGAAMRFIKHQKEQSRKWMEGDDLFENLERETAELIRTVTGKKVPFAEEKEENVNMVVWLENELQEARLVASAEIYRDEMGLSEEEILGKLMKRYSMSKEEILAIIAPKPELQPVS